MFQQTVQLLLSTYYTLIGIISTKKELALLCKSQNERSYLSSSSCLVEKKGTPCHYYRLPTGNSYLIRHAISKREKECINRTAYILG